jgi:hypothetical protein
MQHSSLKSGVKRLSFIIHRLAFFTFAALALSFLSGCMVDNPNETDMPWAAPAGWEGTMPLPGGYMDRYQ